MLSKPTNLYCDLNRSINKEKINSKTPKFSWSINDTSSNSTQLKYHILVSNDLEELNALSGNMWDSTVINSAASIGIPYQGQELQKNQKYFWRIRVWNNKGEISPWSDSHSFETSDFNINIDKPEVCLVTTINKPVSISKISASHYFIAFEKAVFGNLKLELISEIDDNKILIHLGEDSINGKEVNKAPLGTIRYIKIELNLKKGKHVYTLNIPPDKRNTGNCAILMPTEIGEVFPFRFCEIENYAGELSQDQIEQMMVHHPFDDFASDFKCSNEILNQVWDICKYTIKATSFCGIYVDGDRERIPYEADAYINQLCHYCVDNEFVMARKSHEYLIRHSTWPTEWILHSILMAWADYVFTGNPDSLQIYYEDLKAKALLSLKRNDGLISTMTGQVTKELLASIYLLDKNNPNLTATLKDIVDWPPGSFATNGTGERDDYEMKEINNVVNAFHYYGLVLLSKIAKVVGKIEDAGLFSVQSELVKKSFNAIFLDAKTGLYRDGEGSEHISLHGNMFPLVFGLALEENKKKVATYLQSRGMVCSVYGAQYFLEALYQNGGADHAFQLMTANDSRSWVNMIQSGATMTMEAWDIKYKKNLDWNHAWGAAPANIIPMYLMGIKPLEPGFGKIEIYPQISDLTSARVKFPSIRGPIQLNIQKGMNLSYEIILPANTEGVVYFPHGNKKVFVNDQEVNNEITSDRMKINMGSGRFFIRN